MSKLIKPKDAADILGISLKTIYEWVKEDKLPHVYLYSELRFRDTDISDIVKNGLHSPTPINNIQKSKPIAKKQERIIGLWEKKPEKQPA